MMVMRIGEGPVSVPGLRLSAGRVRHGGVVGLNPYEGTDKSISKGATMEETLQEIAHQLTRIADQGEQAGMQISRGDALEAWGLRIYEDDFLSALTRLGIEVTD